MLYNKPNFLYPYCITEGKMADDPPPVPKVTVTTVGKRKASNPGKSGALSVQNPSNMVSTPTTNIHLEQII